MSSNCRHAHANNDGDLWCAITHENYIEEKRSCYQCKRKEAAKCLEPHIIGHAHTVDQILIRVKSVIANGV